MSDTSSSPSSSASSSCEHCIADITGTVTRLCNLHAPAFLTPSVPTESIETPPLIAGEGSTGESILYLAYGSNLNKGTFQGRRGVKPLSATVVTVPTLTLVFDLPGIAYLEPCFANVRAIGKGKHAKKVEPEVEDTEATLLLSNVEKTGYHDHDGQGGDNDETPLVGVVYEVTKEDYATIIATEGGGASYADVLVECIPIPSEGCTSTAFSHLRSIKAHTLLAPVSKTRRNNAQASARYLGLITSGAEQHSLPESYRNYLARFKPYKITTVRQHIGRALFAALWLPVIFSIFGIGRLIRSPGEEQPEWITKMNELVFRVMWRCYDSGFRRFFGDGERTEGDGGVGRGEEQEELDEKRESVMINKKRVHKVGDMFVPFNDSQSAMDSSVASLSASWERL